MSNWGVRTDNVFTGNVVSLTSGVSPAPGAWVELSAALPTDVDAVTVFVYGRSGWGGVELGVGSSGSEIALPLPSIAYGGLSSTCITVPVRLPAGIRVCARKVQTSTVHRLLVQFHASSSFTPTGYARWVRYGGNESWTNTNYQSDIVFAGGGSMSLGAWVEIAASTPFDARYLIFTTHKYTAGSYDDQYYLQIGTGSSGNEVAIPALSQIDNGWGYSAATSQMMSTYAGYANIPAGTRLAVRAASAVTSAAKSIYLALGG